MNASAETAEAAIAALRKLRREILVTFFIIANSFPGAGGKSKRPAPFAGRVLQIKTTLSLCVIHKDRIGKVRFCGATLLALLCKLQSLSRRANTPLSCNGDFRPKLLRLAAHLPGPRRPTKLCPALARFHCPGSLKMRCAGSLPPHRFDCIIHFIGIKSRGNFKNFFFLRYKVILPCIRPALCGACARQSRPCTPAIPQCRPKSAHGSAGCRRAGRQNRCCFHLPGTAQPSIPRPPPQ